jgi:isoquinoline 1-oxidoreductase beta subunit
MIMPEKRNLAMLPSPLLLTRRELLRTSGAGGLGLLIAFQLPDGALVATQKEQLAKGAPFAPNAFLRIAPDNTVTIIAKHVEFGQGTYTGLSTIVAEELDADWSQVRVESAPADAARYNNLFFGQVQGTGGSTAMANSWDQHRQAGAMARAMLIAAAARDWGVVDAGDIMIQKGIVSHARSNRRATFGELASKAASLPPPSEVKLKDPKTFRLVGHPIGRLDSASKTDGSAIFTMDVSLPGMLTAVIVRPPRFGAKVKSFDLSAARRVRGVVNVVEVPAGVAVLARNFWAARKGRDALTIEWDESGAEKRGSDELFAEYRKLAEKPGAIARRDGDATAAIGGAARTIEAVYEFPYLAHAPMEPMDCVVRLGNGECELWAGSQLQTVDQAAAAKTLGLPPEKVQIHTLLAGGSFGRRATPNADVAVEAASIAKAIRGRPAFAEASATPRRSSKSVGGQPVKLVWTREDDIRSGPYRPLYVHRLRAGLDSSGRIVGWEHRIVGQSLLKGTFFEPMAVKDGIDGTSVEGAANLPYAIPNLTVELHTTDVGVPVLWWRSVGSTHTGFSTEAFLDDLAHAAGRDPVEIRRELLQHHPRHLRTLNLAAEKAGWGSPLPKGRARGVAVHESFNSVVAQIADVSLNRDGTPRIERVVCAVDCGTAINPDVIRAQMEGGIGYGLGAALWSEITLVDGRVQQSNFNDYRGLRIEQMPAVEVHIVPSQEKPTGVGEPGVPPIAPAVANALFHLTGKRVRRLPFARLSG